MYIDKSKHGTFLVIGLTGDVLREFITYEHAEQWIANPESVVPAVDKRPHFKREGY